MCMRLGSVQSIKEIPDDLKDIYRTAWEIEPFVVVDMAADRAPFIDQSQSMTLAIEAPSTALLVSASFYGYEALPDT